MRDAASCGAYQRAAAKDAGVSDGTLGEWARDAQPDSADIVDAVTAGWKNGRTTEQVAAELRMPEKYKDYRLDGAKAIVETIFSELGQSPAAKR